MESKITINGKEYTNEDLQAKLKILTEKLKDSDNNNLPDLIEKLQQKGLSGKILYTVAKTYLNQKTASGEPIISILTEKLEEFSNELNKKDKILSSNTESEHDFRSNQPEQVDPIIKDLEKTKVKYSSIKIGDNPFAPVLIYLGLAGILTAVAFYIRYSFGI